MKFLAIDKMEKCQHGRQIVLFCIYEHCCNREAGGCEECMRKSHSHVRNAAQIRVQDVNKMIEKFNVQSSVKPKCRQFQELVFSFFTQVKTQFTQSLDIVSKSMVNRIGYPLLSNLNHLSAYKKIKHKQYRKLSAKEVRKFISDCKELELNSIIKKEKELYWDEIASNFGLIESFQNLMKGYERLAKSFCKNFKHDSATYKKIEDLKKYLNSLLKVTQKQKQKDSRTFQSYLQTSPSSENIKQTQNSLQRQTINSKIQIQRQKQTQSQLKKNKKLIENSTRSNRKDNQSFSVQREIRFNQQAYDLKEKQIFERKEKLMKMMNSKEKIIGRSMENSVGKELNIFLQAPPQLDFQKSPKQLTKKISSKLTTSVIDSKRTHSQFMRFGNLQTQESAINHQASPRSRVKHDSSTLSFKQELPLNVRQSKDSEQNQFDSKYKYGMSKLPSNESSNSSEEKLAQSQLNKFVESKRRDKMTESSPVILRSQLVPASDEEKSACLYLKALQMNTKQAIKYLKASLSYGPNNLSAAEYLSFVYLKQNKAKQSLDLCNQYLALLVKCEDTQLKIPFVSNKSAALNSLGRYSESILLLEAQLPHIDDAKMYKNLGDAYFFMGINQKCQSNYEKAIGMDAKLDEAMYNLAACLFTQGNFYGADRWIGKALGIDNRNEEYLVLKNEITKKLDKFVDENLN